MTQPASDDRDVDAGGDQVYGRRMPEAVRRHMFSRQRRRGLFSRPDIVRQLEPNARGAERVAVAGVDSG